MLKLFLLQEFLVLILIDDTLLELFLIEVKYLVEQFYSESKHFIELMLLNHLSYLISKFMNNC
jgi:hypothetical protein